MYLFQAEEWHEMTTTRPGRNGYVNGNNGKALADEPLTERQELILKMIAEGRTNSDISDLLGYSESTIRQETIKIYSALKVTGRRAAAQEALKQQIV